MEYNDEEFMRDLSNLGSSDQELISQSTAKLQQYSNDFPILTIYRCLNILELPEIDSTILNAAVLLAHRTILPAPSHPIDVMREAFSSPEVNELENKILENSLSGLRVDNSIIRSTCALIVQILFQIEGTKWESLVPILFQLISESPDESSKLGALEAMINIFDQSPPPEIIEMFKAQDIEIFLPSQLVSSSSIQLFSLISKAIISLLKCSDLFSNDNFLSFFQTLLKLTESGIEEIGFELISLIGNLIALRYQNAALVEEQLYSIINASFESGINNYILGALNAIKEISAHESNLFNQKSKCEKTKKKFNFQIFNFSLNFLKQYNSILPNIMPSFDSEDPPPEIPEDHPSNLCEQIWINWVSLYPMETKEHIEPIIDELKGEEKWVNHYCILQLLSALSYNKIDKTMKGDIDQYLSDSLPFLSSCCLSGNILLSLKAFDVIDQSLTNFRVWGRDQEAIETLISIIDSCSEAPPEIVQRCCLLIQTMAKYDDKDDPSSLCGKIFTQVYEILILKYNEREDAITEDIKRNTSYVCCDLIENAPKDVASQNFEEIYQNEVKLVKELMSDQADISFSHIIIALSNRKWDDIREHAEEIIPLLFGILEKKCSAYEEAMKAIASVIICTKQEQIFDEYIPHLVDYLYEALHSGSPTIIEPSLSALGSLFRNKFEQVNSFSEGVLNTLSDIWQDQNIRPSTYIAIAYCVGDIVKNYVDFPVNTAEGISNSIINYVNFYDPQLDMKEMINEAYDLYYSATYSLTNILKNTTDESWRENAMSQFNNILISIEQTLMNIGLEYYSTIGVVEMMRAFGEVYGLSGAKLVLKKGRKFLITAKNDIKNDIIYHNKSNDMNSLYRRVEEITSFLMNLK